MSTDLLIAAFLAWLAAALLALTGRGSSFGRVLLCCGSVIGIGAAILALPDGSPGVLLPTQLAGATVSFRLTPDGAWLLGFGLAPAALACALATPAQQGLTMRAFRDSTPYSGEDLLFADSPAITARCTREAATPGMCLSERRIEGADLTFRFPRSWLAQWRDVASAMDRLTLQLHGGK